MNWKTCFQLLCSINKTSVLAELLVEFVLWTILETTLCTCCSWYELIFASEIQWKKRSIGHRFALSCKREFLQQSKCFESIPVNWNAGISNGSTRTCQVATIDWNNTCWVWLQTIEWNLTLITLSTFVYIKGFAPRGIYRRMRCYL